MSVYQKGKKKKWHCKFQVNGIRHNLVLNNAKDKKHAELLEGELKAKFSHGEIIDKKEIKFFWLCEQFEEYAKNNRKNYDKDKGMVKKLKDFYGNCNVNIFESYLVEKYRTKRREDGMKPATINKEIGILRRMFSIAVDNGWMLKNPALKKSVKPMAVENTEKKVLTIEEEKRLLSACTGNCVYLKPIIICALHSAMRKSEILNLEWCNVDLKTKLITILIQKNSKKSYIPISDTLLEELTKLYAVKTSGYVFVNPITNKPYVNIRNNFKKILKQAQIKGFNFHSLRHTACTRMLEKGVHPDVVQAIMRHSNIAITLEVYNHINQNRKIEAIKVLNDYSK